LDQIEKILDWYSEINPLSTADRELIYIDLMYPTGFLALLKTFSRTIKAKVRQRLKNSKAGNFQSTIACRKASGYKIAGLKGGDKMKIALICTEKLPVPPVAGGAVQLYISEILPYLKERHNITVFSKIHPGLSRMKWSTM